VIDLGSGDGRMVITAAKKHGARGFGVDLDGGSLDLPIATQRTLGFSDRAVFYERDLYQTDLGEADGYHDLLAAGGQPHGAAEAAPP